jgi:hypothetical protein
VSGIACVFESVERVGSVLGCSSALAIIAMCERDVLGVVFESVRRVGSVLDCSGALVIIAMCVSWFGVGLWSRAGVPRVGC